MLQSVQAAPRSRRETLDSTELAHELVEVASGRKATDIVLLDIRPVSLIADYFLMASGQSERQLRAIADEMQRQLKEEHRLTPLHVEGTAESGWRILDYGGVIAHIMSPQMRARYGLEELWRAAQLVVRILEP